MCSFIVLGMNDYIGHIDCDCFYVSAERIRRPEMRGVPAGVLGNQGVCVIARSYEMKAHKITVGMPLWEAEKLCPKGVYVKRDFRWYEVISKKLLNLLKTVSDNVEYYSVDEMFFDCGLLCNSFDANLEEATLKLQEDVWKKVKVPASIGIAPTRTLAKLSSDCAKPYGVYVLTDEKQIEKFLEAQPVEELCGIGRKSAYKLHEKGVHNCLQFRQYPQKQIRDLLTIKGEELWLELHGEKVSPIVSKHADRKTIMRGGSVVQKTKDPIWLNGMLVRNTERLVEALRVHEMRTSKLGLKVDFEGHLSWYESFTFTRPTKTFSRLVAIAKHLMSKVPIKRRVTHLHLFAENLTKSQYVQRTFFEPKEVKAIEKESLKIDGVKHAINSKLGRFAVRSGETLFLSHLYNDVCDSFDISDIYGKKFF